MRFDRILVEHFQVLVRAELAFGAGLNVVYGPNDFGKSTLAQALRAALLAPPKSAACTPFQPWYADAAPRVTLSFVDDEDHYWKVKKTFETSAESGSAELHHSKDGLTYALDVKGRQVEERLRQLVGWGIAAPGGKGAPRGLPESFLAHTLLAAQTDVDRILGQSLTEDASDTGKVRLGRSLATLAQDPLFKKVLEAAQREVDACFTPKGLRTRAQGSRFVEAGQIVKRYEDQLQVARKRADEAGTTAGAVTSLRARQTELIQHVSDAQTGAELVRHRSKRWRAREEAAGKVHVARNALQAVDAHAMSVAAATAEVESLLAALGSREAAVARAATEREGADAALRAAEESHRLATSEDSARDRALRLAQAEAELAELGTRSQAAEVRREKLAEAIAAREAAEQAKASVAKAQDHAVAATRNEATVQQEVADLERALERARMVVEYGGWKTSLAAMKEASAAAESAAKAREDAALKQGAAEVAAERATQSESAIATKEATLPSPALLKALLQLERLVERGEAALGGGLSVVVRARSPTGVRAVVDQSTVVEEHSMDKELVLEAERSVRLGVADLLEVDVTAGGAEQRRDLAKMRARWETEAVPVLNASGLDSLPAIEDAWKQVGADRQLVEAARREVEALRTQAMDLRTRASLQDDQAAKLASARTAHNAREEALRGHDHALLEREYAKLGAAGEAQAAVECGRVEKMLNDARVRAGQITTARGVADYKVTDAVERCAVAQAAAATLTASLAGADPVVLVEGLAREIHALATRRDELAKMKLGLTAEATDSLREATKAVERAHERVQAAKASCAEAATQRDLLLSQHAARVGHRDAVKAQLDAMNQAAVIKMVEDAENALAAFANDVPTTEAGVLVAETAIQTATQALQALRTELHHAEGALSKVGGMAAAEEVVQLQEAIATAQARERELAVDADAYKLLRDTLRDVENDEGAHLGRALSGAVTARFQELTEKRYGGLRLDPALKTEDVRVVGTGATDVIGALSVGTREQLATLIRLTIAEQLKSAIVLDDHLVQTDPKRLAWFRDVLRRTSVNTQVIVLTCRPEDYLSRDELPIGEPTRDLAGGTVRVIDFARMARRWSPTASQRPTRASEAPRDPRAQGGA